MEETGHAGFTLVELLVTVAVVALLAGMAAPALTGFIERGRLQGATELLIQELREARNRAVTFQRTVYFTFSGSAAGSWCYGWDDANDCDCRLPADEAGACTTSDGVRPILHRQQASDFPLVSLALPGVASVYSLRIAAVRGTASATSVSLSNQAGETRVIISPLGRVRGCAARGGMFPAC
jgi:prepilin-type N-terminal cleavage/methylation domain-containing protein